MIIEEFPMWRLAWSGNLHHEPSLEYGMGPDRVVTDQPDADFEHQPVGFVQPKRTRRTRREPLTWEGDQA